MLKTVLCIPDLHLPFSIDLTPIYSVVSQLQPDVVIQLGDLFDQFAYSHFAKSLTMTASEEMFLARKQATTFWKTIAEESSSKTRLIQLKGNHDERVDKRILEKLPEINSLCNLRDLYKFNHVETVNSERESVVIDGVRYLHGYLCGIGKHLSYFNASVVHGHTHQASTLFQTRDGKPIFELQCGHLADETQRPLQYGRTTLTKWTLGFGVVDRFGPRFVAL